MNVLRTLTVLFFIMFLGCSSSGDDAPQGPIVGGPSDDIDPGSTDDGSNPDSGDPFLYNATQDLKDVADFPIGNIVSASKLASTSTENETFKGILNAEYNSITAENDMKMANMFTGQDTYDFSDGDAIVAYAKENGFRVHGHALIWHQSIPNWLNSFAGTDEEFEAQIEGYVKATVAHFAEAKDTGGNPIVTSWDVVNEYFDGSSVRSTLFSQRMGNDYHKKVFQWAREADPDVKLFYNDYNIAGEVGKRNAIIGMVNDFQTNGIPIDGIGMQMHLNHDWPTSDLPTAIQDISDTGLLVHVSELDVKVNYGDDITELTEERAAAQEVQFQRVGYYYTTIVPAAQQYGLTLWGFRDRDSWLYDGGSEWPLLYDNDFDTKIAHRGLVAGLNGENPE
ncbi:endo-1,4-beta-xylanase [Flagellimonas pelagia]|uniref:Beta-xylanase n=1 Tax=Flagellimonas pelagia TaxID=2306998 RepID=A0A3A1NK35_9FLAO|nr:endo-1,4-beta-xylanase [Allomuricauda maritima]RIV46420.1 1,4-beta-xylanase [Allomuricauda maritima]TXJ99080.1 endo-1,4-beta-xylanase [Allomuricauda maritima]